MQCGDKVLMGVLDGLKVVCGADLLQKKRKLCLKDINLNEGRRTRLEDSHGRKE